MFSLHKLGNGSFLLAVEAQAWTYDTIEQAERGANEVLERSQHDVNQALEFFKEAPTPDQAPDEPQIGSVQPDKQAKRTNKQ